MLACTDIEITEQSRTLRVNMEEGDRLREIVSSSVPTGIKYQKDVQTKILNR